MNDECDGLRLLAGAALPPGLREHVLDRVARELKSQRRWRRVENAIGVASLFVLATAVVVNASIADSIGRKFRQCAGPSFHERRVRAFVESLAGVVDEEGARSLEAWLLAQRPAPPDVWASSAVALDSPNPTGQAATPDDKAG